MADEFGELNDKLGGNNLIYNESEDAYYIQHGADSVPKKLGSPEPFTSTLSPGNSTQGHYMSSWFPLNVLYEMGYTKYSVSFDLTEEYNERYDTEQACFSKDVSVMGILTALNPANRFPASGMLETYIGQYSYIGLPGVRHGSSTITFS